MAAMNISLPDDLRERMDGVSGVTWSQVAAKAFELEVNSRTMGKDDDAMTAAIERLKASRQKAEQEDRASGLEHGKRWAMKRANWRELCAVANMAAKDGRLEAVLGNFGWEIDDVTDLFGRDAEGYNPPITEAEVLGFIEGARLVREEVE